MASGYLHLRRIAFSGPGRSSEVEFVRGVNVICGASETGKSFLAEAIDFMLGGSDLREISERVGYATIDLDLSSTDGSRWRFERATSGGDFALTEGDTETKTKLRRAHAEGRVDNVSGYLLSKIGLFGKRILRSSTKGTTNSLSFRNLARLIIIQEGEIQQKGSPFWDGQFTLKTAELATIKLLLTGIDDSAVISTAVEGPDNTRQIAAIQESGSLLVYVEQVPCPLCGAPPDAQHIDEKCDGDVASVVMAASAEIQKIDRLVIDLSATVEDLRTEFDGLSKDIRVVLGLYREVEQTIRQSISPEVEGAQSQFSELIEQRSAIQNAVGMYERLERLELRRAELDNADEAPEQEKVAIGIPEAVAHQFSMKVEHILRAWNFPGDCRVHFDKETSDFVIDGKPRGSRGKGLRAITHAAISIALLEFCRERSLAHPGFVVLDSPLLAYFKPEGEDDAALQGTDLKERFYDYLKAHHGRDSQIIIIENQHPPESVEQGMSVTVFTKNPTEGRVGLL